MDSNLQSINYSSRSFRFYQYHINEVFHRNSPIENIYLVANSEQEIKTIIAHLAVQFHLAGQWDWIRLNADEEINEEYKKECGEFDVNYYYHYLTQVVKPHHRIIFGQYIDQIAPMIDYRKSALIVALPITFKEIFCSPSIKDSLSYWLKSKTHSNIEISKRLIKSLIQNHDLE